MKSMICNFGGGANKEKGKCIGSNEITFVKFTLSNNPYYVRIKDIPSCTYTIFEFNLVSNIVK